MLYVKVNATSANVCVGFDVLGLALNLSNTFYFEKQASFCFEGFEKKYSSTNTNLVYEAYCRAFEYINMKPIPVLIGFKGEIPVSRGLGSSSSLIVAGVYAASYMAGANLSKEQILEICSEIEGHPDNVAPAIYGGLVACYRKDSGYHAISYPVSSKLKFMVVIPPFMLSTHMAREALPKALSYPDIVHNLSRIIHIPKAFADGDLGLLIDLFDDRLHEPYRGKLIENYAEIKEICHKEKVAFAISGSGSTMLVVSYDTAITDKIKKFNYEIKTLDVGQGVIGWEE